MSQDTTPTPGGETDIEITSLQVTEDFESAADHHRLAAQHFAAAARYHLAAAEADEEGDADGCARQGYNAFDKIHFWRTPVSQCKSQAAGCVPYHRWATDYIAVLGGR